MCNQDDLLIACLSTRNLITEKEARTIGITDLDSRAERLGLVVDITWGTNSVGHCRQIKRYKKGIQA